MIRSGVTSRRLVGAAASAGLVALLLSGCGSDESTGQGTTSTSTTEPTTDAGDTTGADAADPASDAADGPLPAGLRPGSEDFPFPVPQDWREHHPFTQEKLGKDDVMYAALEYPGDAQDAAGSYRALLEQAGFTADRYAPGELTNQASLVAEGRVDGTLRKAIIDFDTNADGVPLAQLHVSDSD